MRKHSNLFINMTMILLILSIYIGIIVLSYLKFFSNFELEWSIILSPIWGSFTLISLYSFYILTRKEKKGL